jgi:hypothetical protein
MTLRTVAANRKKTIRDLAKIIKYQDKVILNSATIQDLLLDKLDKAYELV